MQEDGKRKDLDAKILEELQGRLVKGLKGQT